MKPPATSPETPLSLWRGRASALLTLVTALAVTACAGSEGEIPEGAADAGAGGGSGTGFTLETALQGTIGSGSNLNDVGPSQIAQSQAAYAYLTSVATATEMAPLIAAGVGGMILNYSVYVEATQGIELFSLYVPDTPASQPRPLLAAFHGAATSHGDIYFRAQEFFIEADQRGWFLVAPLQANLTGPQDISFASVQSQLHVEVLIELILDTYNIDRDRIYGAGFSMGGGNALSYAARHRDRRTGAMAAVVNHTGSVALADVYRNAPPVTAGVMEVIFGGPPSGPVFEWQRSSLIEVDALGALLPQGMHMARNLEHVPIQTWFNTQDSFGYLRNQAQELGAFMQALPFGTHQMVTVPGGLPNCVDQHCWGTLDINAACSWLDQQTLERNPSSGTILADRDARWGRFDVEQRFPGTFTSFDFTVTASANELELRNALNLRCVAASPAGLGLQVAQPMTLRTRSFPSQGATVKLSGFLSAPSSVLRNGLPFGPTCGGAANSIGWCHDAQTGVLTIRETSNLSVIWQVQ